MSEYASITYTADGSTRSSNFNAVVPEHLHKDAQHYADIVQKDHWGPGVTSVTITIDIPAPYANCA